MSRASSLSYWQILDRAGYTAQVLDNWQRCMTGSDTRPAPSLASACAPQGMWQQAGSAVACCCRRRRCCACCWLCSAALAHAGARASPGCGSRAGETSAAGAGHMPARHAQHGTVGTAWPGAQQLPVLGQQSPCCWFPLQQPRPARRRRSLVGRAKLMLR